MRATLQSVNVGTPREVEFSGELRRTTVWRFPVDGAVTARDMTLAGDEVGDPVGHGGYDKAVYAYGMSDYAWWTTQLGRDLEFGNFGENLTLDGLEVSHAVIGEQWAIGSAVFEVSGPRTPCWKLGIRMDDPQFPAKFNAANRPGSYLRITTEGTVCAGDSVEVIRRPAHGVTSAMVHAAYFLDTSLAADALAAEADLSPWWIGLLRTKAPA